MSALSESALTHQEQYKRQYAEAQPFHHVVMPDFLKPELCRQLLEDFPGFESRFALNEMGEVGGKAVRMDVRDISDAYRQLDRFLQTREFLDYMSSVTGIPDLRYDPDYVGGGTHENREGQGLDPHIDFNHHPGTGWHRRLNLIIYLNTSWQDHWGGSLELHSDPWNDASNRIVTIPPLFNHAVVFETNEVSWHGFSTIRLPESDRFRSRKSFAIYLYTETRPDSESASPHATVYVPPGMPTDLPPGKILDAADVEELRVRFARLRTQLRYLYKRELEFGAQIASLEAALAETRSGLRLELQGYATQPRGCIGLWPDGWASRELSAVFMPIRATRELHLEVWTPPQLPSDQELRIQLDDSTSLHHLRRGRRSSIALPLKAKPDREIRLDIHSSLDWTPASTGESGDQRALAFKLLSAVLQH